MKTSKIRAFIKNNPALANFLRKIYSTPLPWVYRYFYFRLRPSNQSFAANEEDLVASQLLGEVKTFIDIGANDGYNASNTFYFAIRGAQGFLFEPVRQAYLRLFWLYSFNKSCKCRQVAISNHSGQSEIVKNAELSFISETEDRKHSELFENHSRVTETITCSRLDEEARTLGIPNQVDLMSIDVEGHELAVLESINFSERTFRLLVIETHLLRDGKKVWVHKDLSRINELLATFGYYPIYENADNTFYAPMEE